MKNTARPTGVFIDIQDWEEIRKSINGPWPAALARLDLMFIESEQGALPPRRKLMKRWDISERKARTILDRYKSERPKLKSETSQKHSEKTTQVPGIIVVDESTPSQAHIKNVPSISDDLNEDIKKVFGVWESAQHARTNRHNRLTTGRRKVLKAALQAGHTSDDLILVVRMAFEFPEGDFLVDSWRKGGYMDIANLLNREKVDRNVTLAAERWSGNEWVFIKPNVIRFESKYLKLWEHLEFLLGAYPSEPEHLHKNPNVSRAMSNAVRAVGGWRMLGTLRPGRDMEKIKQDFLSEVQSSIAQMRRQNTSATKTLMPR